MTVRVVQLAVSAYVSTLHAVLQSVSCRKFLSMGGQLWNIGLSLSVVTSYIRNRLESETRLVALHGNKAVWL